MGGKSSKANVDISGKTARGWETIANVTASLAAMNVGINERDENGETAIFHAIRGVHIDTVCHLISLGADPNVVSKQGLTPFHVATLIGNTDMIQAVLGADNLNIRAKTTLEFRQNDVTINKGSNVLHILAHRQSQEPLIQLSEVLLCFLDEEEKDDNQQTPHQIAKMADSVRMANVLDKAQKKFMRSVSAKRERNERLEKAEANLLTEKEKQQIKRNSEAIMGMKVLPVMADLFSALVLCEYDRQHIKEHCKRDRSKAASYILDDVILPGSYEHLQHFTTALNKARQSHLANLRKPTENVSAIAERWSQREEIKVNVNWLHRKTKESKYTQVRLVDGGGHRELYVNPSTVTVDFFFNELVKIFFPNGNSVKGPMNAFKISFGDFGRKEITEFKDRDGNNCTFSNYLRSFGLFPSKTTFYMLTENDTSSVRNEQIDLDPEIGVTTETHEVSLPTSLEPLATSTLKPSSEIVQEIIDLESPESDTSTANKHESPLPSSSKPQPSDTAHKHEELLTSGSSNKSQANKTPTANKPKEHYSLSSDPQETETHTAPKRDTPTAHKRDKPSSSPESEVNKPLNDRNVLVRKKMKTGEEAKKNDSDIPYMPYMSYIPQVERKSIELKKSLKHKLGEGAFGTVWEGKWAETPVALKEIKIIRNREFVLKSINNELSILSVVRHPNIVTVMATCLQGTSFYIISELVRGPNLETAIFGPKRYRKLVKRSNCFAITKQLLQAVAYLHEMQPQIIHQDVKPSNVIVDVETANAKLCDLGVSRFRELDGTRTNGAGVPGTLMYMAPECFNEKKANAASDIWSVGCTLVELFTQKDVWKIPESVHPRKVPEFFASMHQNECTPENILEVPITIVHRCLLRDPSRRPTAKDILREI